MRALFEDRRFWIGLLITGLLFHLHAAESMPLGLDTHLHAVYVTDGIADGEADLEWGPVRPDAPDGSTPSEVSADGRWSLWHTWMEAWIRLLGPSTDTLHTMGLVTGIAALVTVFFCTRGLWGAETALRLTALASIYPPLIRSVGRGYQEGAVLLFIALAFTALVLGDRQRRAGKPPLWWMATILCIAAILNLKGMPLQATWGAAALLGVWPSVEGRLNDLNSQQRLAIFGLASLAMMVLVLLRNGVEIESNLGPMLGAWLLAVLLVVFVFVFAGMGLIGRREASMEGEAALLRDAGLLGLGLITGYVAALWVVEAHALDLGLWDIFVPFRFNPRYASLLILPLWWAWMARDGEAAILPDEGREILFAVIIAILLLLNAHILSATGPRGMEVIGADLANEVEDGDEILYVAPAPLAMHRLYSMHLTLDPDNDRDIIAHWRAPDSNWQAELEDCDALGNVHYVLIDPNADVDGAYTDSNRDYSLGLEDEWAIHHARDRC
jgi:hypothetical protein